MGVRKNIGSIFPSRERRRLAVDELPARLGSMNSSINSLLAKSGSRDYRSACLTRLDLVARSRTADSAATRRPKLGDAPAGKGAERQVQVRCARVLDVERLADASEPVEPPRCPSGDGSRSAILYRGSNEIADDDLGFWYVLPTCGVFGSSSWLRNFMSTDAWFFRRWAPRRIINEHSRPDRMGIPTSTGYD